MRDARVTFSEPEPQPLDLQRNLRHWNLSSSGENCRHFFTSKENENISLMQRFLPLFGRLHLRLASRPCEKALGEAFRSKNGFTSKKGEALVKPAWLHFEKW